MNFGLKQKILVVLIGVLALTTALDAGLASYYTNRQNQESAFATLSRDLQSWQNDLQITTQHLKSAALSACRDPVVLKQLAELITFEADVDDPVLASGFRDMARTLAYTKAVSLNRLDLVLRTADLSSIAVYVGGKLSHYVSTSDAGMMVRRDHAPPAWIAASADAAGMPDFQGWPAWRGGKPPVAVTRDAGTELPTVSFAFSPSEAATIEIAIPVQGTVEEMFGDLATFRRHQLVSDLTIADETPEQSKNVANGQKTTLAVLVFSKRIDRAALKELAAKTGKWPTLFSPDGSHRLQINDSVHTPKELLQQPRSQATGTQPQVIHHIVTTERGSFYQALLPWQFDHRTRMILGLTSSRDSTLQNIRETVTAILAATSLILVLSIGVGIYWIGRFIDPIVALTRAVKRISLQRPPDGEPTADRGIRAEELQPIAIDAPDEIGELSAAYDAMIAELRNALDTLEQRVQTRTAELRQQTSYLRTLIDTLPLSVWIKDTECRYLATNQANAAACGRSVEDMVGKSDAELWPRELAEHYCADDTEVMRSRQRKMVEESNAGPRGEAWMEIYRAPVLDEDGTVLGTVGAARDISERKAAEAAREAALAEAVRLARQRSEFLAQMSHELRTPLNAILGYAQILRRDPQQLTRQQAAGLATIQESGQHLLNLINDILDLARVEAGKLTLYPIDINLSLFVRVVTDIIRVKAEEKSVLFSYQEAADLPVLVKVDDKRLRQVLLNLLGNAVKFTDRGAVTLRLLRVPSPDAKYDDPAMARLRFEVQDTGVGMSEQQLSRLFQPFEQVGEIRRREGGSGLGLSISQQFIRLMGGNIAVQSMPGEGTLFWFELDLPIIEAEAAAVETQERVILDYEGPRRKVVIVDDVPQNRIMLMDALYPLGFEVIDVENGQQCVDVLDSVQPDLIVMDVMMPVMDGWEATRRIRQLPAFAHVPIVIVTASATSEDEAKSYAAGANAFLPKPIQHDRLLEIIGEQLSLQWIYKESETSEEKAGDIVVPPPDEMERLYELARLGNMQAIRAQAERLANLDPRYATFARELRTLAQNYQSKAVLALVERYRTESATRATNPST